MKYRIEAFPGNRYGMAWTKEATDMDLQDILLQMGGHGLKGMCSAAYGKEQAVKLEKQILTLEVGQELQTEFRGHSFGKGTNPSGYLKTPLTITRLE